MHPRAFVITLRRAGDRFKRCQEHFKSVGITAETFYGMDGQITGLRTDHTYEVDHPGSNYKMGPKTVSLNLSHYMLWQTLLYQPEDEFWILEDDCLWDVDWEQRYNIARSVLPNDWGLVWIGHCCASDKPGYPVDKNLYVVQWPMCTHAYMIHRRAFPVLLEHCQRIYAPIDITLAMEVGPRVKTYTIRPRLCGQFDTLLPP